MIQLYRIDSFFPDSVCTSRIFVNDLQKLAISVSKQRQCVKLFSSYLESLGFSEDEDDTSGSSSKNIDPLSSSPSFSAFMNSRTVPSNESHMWKPKHASMLGKKPWQPQSSSLNELPKSLSYLDSLAGSANTKNPEPHGYNMQSPPFSSGRYNQNNHIMDASSTVSDVPQSPPPSSAPPAFESWSPPESWSSVRSGTSFLGGMSPRGGIMKKPWKPSTHVSKISTKSHQMFGSSASYLNSIDGVSKSSEISSRSDLPTNKNDFNQFQLSTLRASESSNPPPVVTNSNASEGERDTAYGDHLSPGSMQKPKTKSYMPGGIKGTVAFSSGSYLDNISKPVSEKYDNFSESIAPKKQNSEDVMIPPFAVTNSFLDNLSSRWQDFSIEENLRTSQNSFSQIDESSSIDMNFFPSNAEPIQIVEEFGSITQSPGYNQKQSSDGLIAQEFKYASFLAESDDVERDLHFLREAIMLVRSSGGESSATSAFPLPSYAAVLVSVENEILASAVSDYKSDAIIELLANAGFGIDPTTGWIVSLPDDPTLAKIAGSTLYVTLEPSTEERGANRPTIVNLILQAKISQVVVGSVDPAPDREGKGLTVLQKAGVKVSVVGHLCSECDALIPEYSKLSQSDFMASSRYHYQRFGRPLGLLHCSVIDSDNIEAFARNGNTFGTNLGGKALSYRTFGAYELAPPPDYNNYGEFDDTTMIEADFDDELFQSETEVSSRMMPWCTKAQAVVTTFPRFGNGPPDDNSVTARLNGLKWLATQGERLPPGVERILVLDASDLKDLPLTNSDPNLPAGVDVEAFWAGSGRKPTRVILRRSGLDTARAARAAEAATAAIESSKPATGVNKLRAARQEAEIIQKKLAELQLLKLHILKVQILKRSLEDKGVIVEAIEDGEPVDVLRHLGKESGLKNVVWRAGCWGERGVRAILAGAFQRVAAHVAVDAIGGKFWQLMIAENAIQAACGPQSKVRVQADQDDLSLEYCDDPNADSDCVLTIDGRPVRHVRVDCRIFVLEEARHRELMLEQTQVLEQRKYTKETPWSL